MEATIAPTEDEFNAWLAAIKNDVKIEDFVQRVETSAERTILIKPDEQATCQYLAAEGYFE